MSAIAGCMQWSFWFAGLMNTGPDDRMYDCLPMYHSIGGVVATGALLVRGGSVVIREKFSAQRFLGRHRRRGTARCSSISASFAAISSTRRSIRASARIACGCAAATDCAPTSGRNSSRGSIFREFWNFMRRPKAMSRSTTSKAKSAPSAACRRSSRIAFRWRWSSSTRSQASRRATPTAAASAARPTKSARPSAGSRAQRSRRRVRGLYQRRRRPSGKSCAMCSRPATPGIAPAI